MSKAKAGLIAMELRQDSCIHGYHALWNAVLGQVLLTEGEVSTQRGHDRHAVAVNSKKHSGKIVEYLRIY